MAEDSPAVDDTYTSRHARRGPGLHEGPEPARGHRGYLGDLATVLFGILGAVFLLAVVVYAVVLLLALTRG